MTQYVPLKGSHRTLLARSRPAGPVDLSEMATITVRVASTGKSSELETLVQAEARKPFAERRYLTHDELSARFGATSANLDLVEKYAQEHDLRVVQRDAGMRLVTLRGTLKDLLAAFPARLGVYHHGAGAYRGRRGAILLPQHLSGVVTGVFGFDTRQRRRSLRRALAEADATSTQGVAASAYAKRYNFPETSNGTTLDGTGQTVAIIELGGGFRASDVTAFCAVRGLPPPSLVSVSVDNHHNHPTTLRYPDGEVLLDIEVLCSVVPKANLVVYFSGADDRSFLDALNVAIHDAHRKPSVLSVSWGGPEVSADQQSIDAFHELFVEAAALGITTCVTTGDHGVADAEIDQWDGAVHVDHPGCDNMVLACGGTQIDQGVDVVWNDGTSLESGGWVTGGGISEVFPVPDYQAAAGLPTSIVTKKPGRGIPDLAMCATDYAVRVDGLDSVSGGTSAVAPLMAGLVARLNQAKGKRVGFLNPFLYANAAAVMKDVKSGNNGVAGTVEGYSAGTGWDACTGLGTPDGQAILNKL